MDTGVPVYLLYSFLPEQAASVPDLESVELSESNGPTKAGYQILQAFTEVGALGRETFEKVYEKSLGRRPHETQLGPFSSLQELNDFSLELVQELHSSRALLLSAYDYNMGIDRIERVEQFHELFDQFGQVLKNPNIGPKRSHFFKRIFKD